MTTEDKKYWIRRMRILLRSTLTEDERDAIEAKIIELQRQLPKVKRLNVE